ncbi:CaiB/BaiF CoA-transferase family protein [Acidovorax sp. Leaf160]|uniref:CaiB/BaiF CoA transferase family protein n=1 Tax=Acidovorax sp. Leaf160 TaxID=1736280 RepID=UPI0006F841A5|nr:CaiB/BaiF CoA-transferase family protein [Acidovorax sp. Leaf160]KQR45878.1 CoA-transferase [Acidovorax sp. Leaf160]
MTSPASTPAGALAGIRVLDLSRVLAGPWCTQVLADLGADVVKVERPGVGDDTRHWGPPFLRDADGHDTDQAAYFTACNRNKRSITIDMSTAEGQQLIRQMALQADVVVENFKVGGLQQYGLDHASLRALNPRLIYCSVTGFGQTGPYAERAGYDLMVQAMTGLMSITGRADEAPGGGPLRVGVAVIDLFTGLYASNAILAALHVRDNATNGTGEGQHIDMALLDVGMAVLANQAAGFLATGEAPGRMGNSHPSLVPYQDFPTADGNMLLAIGNDGQFARFCAAAGQPQWAQDARFATNTLRVKHRSTLIPLMEAVTRTRSTADWVALLEDKAVPCGPINNVAQAFDDPQVQARQLRVELPRWADGTQAPGDGVATIATVASPLRLSATPPVLRHAPPALGQHTAEVLQDWGIGHERLAEWRAAGVV